MCFKLSCGNQPREDANRQWNVADIHDAGGASDGEGKTGTIIRKARAGAPSTCLSDVAQSTPKGPRPPICRTRASPANGRSIQLALPVMDCAGPGLS